MKTLLIIAGFKKSLVNFRGDMIRDLISTGYTVHVAAPGLGGTCETQQALVDLGAIPHDIYMDRNGNNPVRDFACLMSLVRLMWRIRPSLILPYTVKAVIYGNLAARLCFVKHRFALITGLGGALGGQPSLKRRVIIQLHKMAFKGLCCAIFQNRNDKDFFETHQMLTSVPKTAIVNGSGINLTRFPQSTPPVSPISFLLIARLLKAKGIAEFARAATNLKVTYPDAEFKVIGWREDNPDFVTQSVIDRWEASGSVQFLGEMSDVRPALKASSVMVLPSYYPEGLPRTLLEALSTGRAIVTTDTPGCRETVLQDKNGYLIAPQSAQDIETACRAFLDDPQKVTTFGAASRGLAEDKFDASKVNADIIDILNTSGGV